MMKKTLENRQSFTRRLMQLLVLMAMLLAPKGALAEDYGLTVAGVAVTSDNASSITGQNISEGTVSYTPKTGTTPAMLILNGAYIYGEIVSSVDEDLTIMVIGVNTITTSYNHAIIGKSGGTNNNLRLAYNGTGNGVELRVNGLSSIDELPLNWTSCTKIWKTLEFGENEEGLNPDLCDWYTKEKCGFISIAPSTKYDVWIGGIQLTSNHDSSDGVSFSENRLTLENATIAPANAYGIEYKGTKDFTISLIGNSSIQTTGSNEAIRYGGAGTDTPKLSFAHDNSGFPCSLQLSSASVSVISSGFSSIEGVNGINQINSNDNKLGLTPTNPLQYGTNGLVTTDETPAAVTSVKFGTPFETYGVSVAGTSVTSDNYHDVLKDGTVSFNSQTNTLTLNNATIDMSQKTGYPIESSLTNLNVNLIGSSILIPNSASKSGIRYTGSESNPTVTLNADNSSYCLLKVNGVSDRAAMFSGYTNSNSIVTQGDGWRTYTEGSGDDVSSTMEYIDYYDLTVAGVPVTSKNATNIQGENITGSVSVSQDGWKIVLTLNGATISGGVVFDSSKDLYVNFNGENSISGGDSYAINSTDDTMTSQWIVFEKADNSSSATITLTNNTQNDKSGTIGGGFDVTKYDGLYKIDDNNATQFTTTFTTDLFANGSGTMSDPYIIKTANDLKNFSNFINRNVIENTACAKLSDDINAETGLDCTNLTGFEPIGAGDLPYKGTFNGNGKTISNLSYTTTTDLEYVGLFGYVSGATITNLTISGCTFSGTKHVGGIAGYINDATISSCTVNNSTISCINTETGDNVWTAGGIVGYCEYDPSGEEPTTVSGNTVTGTTTISCSKTAGSGNAVAGAIVGHHRTTTFTNNIYEYSVSVSTKQPTDENATVFSGYTKRGSGCTIDDSGETPQAEYELTDVDGIAMYTMKVILPETSEGSVMGLNGTYYDIFEDDTDWGILVAPGQTARITVTPDELYKIVSFSAVNLSTEEEIDSEDITVTNVQEDNEYVYTKYEFTMPGADVELTAGFAFDISNRDYLATTASATYTGSALEPQTVKLTPNKDIQGEELVLTNGIDFTITGYQFDGPTGLVDVDGQPINAGTYNVMIKGTGNYTGETTVFSYIINKANIPSGKYTVPTKKTGLMTYTGAEQALVNAGSVDESLKDIVELKYYHKSITKDEYEGTGYSFPCEPGDGEYEANVPKEKNAGYYAIVYKFFGGDNYYDIPSTGLMKVAIDTADIAKATIEEIADTAFTGEAIEPELTVTFGQTPMILEVDEDYTVAYTNNINVGTATATITGKGNFKGTKSANFNIVNKTLDVTFVENQTWASFYNTTEDFNLPNNVMAYIVTEIGQNSVTVAPINYVPKNVAVLLENNTTTTGVTNTSATGNLLQGADANGFAVTNGATVYALYNNKMMRVASGTTIPAGKCYLVVGVVNAGAPQLNIVFENEGNTTGISDAARLNDKSEMINDNIYDLQGRKVVYPKKKGLYIQKGRKVVVNNK